MIACASCEAHPGGLLFISSKVYGYRRRILWYGLGVHHFIFLESIKTSPIYSGRFSSWPSHLKKSRTSPFMSALRLNCTKCSSLSPVRYHGMLLISKQCGNSPTLNPTSVKFLISILYSSSLETIWKHLTDIHQTITGLFYNKNLGNANYWIMMVGVAGW